PGGNTMKIHWTIPACLALAMLATPGQAQQPRLAAAAAAMGATNLNSIQYTGSGSVFGFGQAYEPGERWPRFVQRSYTAAVNFSDARNAPHAGSGARRASAAWRRWSAGCRRTTYGARGRRPTCLAGGREPGDA